MHKHKTSIFFVNNEGQDTKIVQVPTNILLYWKKYVLIFFSIIGILVCILGVFIYQSTGEMYKEKLAKANRIKSLIDIQKVKKAFKSIDESTLRVNKFLIDRGLTQMEIKNSGGEEENFEITDINEITSYYANKMNNIEEIVKNVPIGSPHLGEITSGFGYRGNPFTGLNTEHHSGIDFRGQIGDPVKTTAEGVVEFAGVKGGYGNCIVIQHSNNLKTLYGHLSKISVTEGKHVKLGEVIGALGNSGRSTGPHLHYEIIREDKKIDPQPYIKL